MRHALRARSGRTPPSRHIDDELPFPDHSFDAVVCLNTLHNLERPDLIMALREIERVARVKPIMQVDSYRTEEERDLFLDWVLTAHTHDYPQGWEALFAEAGYRGDYYWTIIACRDASPMNRPCQKRNDLDGGRARALQALSPAHPRNVAAGLGASYRRGLFLHRNRRLHLLRADAAGIERHVGAVRPTPF